jgi:hypothetical protein
MGDASTDRRYDYLVIQEGKEMANVKYPVSMSTLTWSPLLLTGNTKFPKDLMEPKFAENCLEIAEKFLKSSMQN